MTLGRTFRIRVDDFIFEEKSDRAQYALSFKRLRFMHLSMAISTGSFAPLRSPNSAGKPEFAVLQHWGLKALRIYQKRD